MGEDPRAGPARICISIDVERDYRLDGRLTTRGIDLNALVGRRFRVGDVLCEGMRLCEPCEYLEGLLKKSLLQPLLHRGGLRADVLEDGEIRVGDLVKALGTDADTPPA